jgi:hypothetical protein
MFTIEQVRNLIKSMNVGSISESEMEVLAKDTMDKLNESFKEQFEKGKAEGMREANESVRKARLESFQRGQEKGMATLNEAVAKAEDVAFKAGREKGISESEEEEAEISKDILDLIEQLCIIFDKYTKLTEIVVHEQTKEEFKESFRDALVAFCDKKVNECLPDKEIVNYHRLQQLESFNESVKKMYLINDIDVAAAVDEAKASCQKEFNEAKMMAESQMQRRIAAEKMLESVQAENFLLKKVQNLPASDQKQLLESFKGASVETINESFDRELQKIAQRRSASIPRTQVNDVICESRLHRIRAARARKMEESAKRARQEEDAALRQMNESSEDIARRELENRMGQYAKMCETFQRNGL